MLTTEDREEIKRLVGAMIAESGASASGAISASVESGQIADVLARAIGVFGTREKALRWLRTPVRSLGDKTSISLLNNTEGLVGLQDTLGRVEHGVW